MRAAAFGVALLLASPAVAQTARKPAPRPPARAESVKQLLELARSQSARRDPQAALASLARARKLAPNSEDVLSAYAQMALAVGAPVPALLALEPLTRMAASVGQYHYLYGVALMQAGDLEAADEALRQAERREPNHVLTLIALGLTLNGRKQHAEAKTYLRRALDLEPDSVEATAVLAEAEEGLGEEADAEVHALRALAREPDHATANLALGLVRMKQERYGEARDALVRAVAADPSSAKAHYQLSLAYARLGDAASAQEQVALYQRALREVEDRVRLIHGQGPSGEGPGP